MHDGALFNLCWYYDYSYFRENKTKFYQLGCAEVGSKPKYSDASS